MAWQNEMVLILRHLIDDISTPIYTDSRLEEAIMVSAQLIKFEVDFDQTYVIDVDSCTISPDPTTLEVKDDGFISLVCLKTACVILNGEAKTNSRAAVSVSDGPSTINMGGVARAIEERAKQYCADYRQALLQYQMGNARAGQAVLTPYTYENIPPIRGNF